MYNNSDQFYFELDSLFTKQFNPFSRKIYQWKYNSPPNWLTKKINEITLNDDLRYINELSDESTIVENAYFVVGFIMTCMCLYIYLIQSV